MKKYLFTLSTLALSLGMTHAADGVLTFADEDAGAASTVFGGGSVVAPSDTADLVAAMILGDDAAGAEDAASGAEISATNPVKKKKVRKPDASSEEVEASSDEEEVASPSGENAPTFPGDAAEVPAPVDAEPAVEAKETEASTEEAAAPVEVDDAEMVREGTAVRTAPSPVEADAGSEHDEVNTAEEGSAPAGDVGSEGAEAPAPIDAAPAVEMKEAETNTEEGAAPTGDVGSEGAEAPAAEPASDAKPASDVVGSVD